MIPQFRPNYNREQIAKEVSEYILNEDNFFSEHTYTKKFEEELASFLNVKHCICVTNGTMALSLALLANGIKAGDYVLIPNITMMSTQAAVEIIGAIPVFVDVDPVNLCMDLFKAKQLIINDKGHSKVAPWNKIRACIYVTLNGRSHDVEELDRFNNFCKFYNVQVIEDNAQSFGSYYLDKTAKDVEDMKISCPLKGIGCFSLSFHKLLSTGQGGFCITNNDELAIRLRELKNVGRVEGGADFHERFGYNAKFTDIQAIMGLVELKNIYGKITNKRFNFTMYRYYLKDIEEVIFLDTNIYNVCPWFVDCYVHNRDGLQKYLKDNGIGTRAIYPALTTQKINLLYSDNVNVPLQSIISSQCGLWLPSSVDITEEEIKFVCDKIRNFYGN